MNLQKIKMGVTPYSVDFYLMKMNLYKRFLNVVNGI